MYKVVLSACGNIDHYENPYDNIVNGVRVNSEIVEFNSIEECQKAVRAYIEENDLGGGNWDGGQVFENDKQIGFISYNGRYWSDIKESQIKSLAEIKQKIFEEQWFEQIIKIGNESYKIRDLDLKEGNVINEKWLILYIQEYEYIQFQMLNKNDINYYLNNGDYIEPDFCVFVYCDFINGKQKYNVDISLTNNPEEYFELNKTFNSIKEAMDWCEQYLDNPMKIHEMIIKGEV